LERGRRIKIVVLEGVKIEDFGYDTHNVLPKGLVEREEPLASKSV